MKQLAFLILIAITMVSCEQIQNTMNSVFGKNKTIDEERRKTYDEEVDVKTVEKDVSAPSSKNKNNGKNLEEGSFASIRVSSYLYFRKEPIVAEYTKFSQGSKLRHLHDGDQVKIILKTNKCERIGGEFGCWYKVEYLGSIGYVFGAFLN